MLRIQTNKQLPGISASLSHNTAQKIKNTQPPAFQQTKPDLNEIKNRSKKYKSYKNIILIGSGGSRTNAWAFYHSLFLKRNKTNFEFLSSAEPELIANFKKKYQKKDTLVLIISKSGDNINALEPLFFFLNYPVLVITGETNNTLSQIAATMQWDTIAHPEVGGRFSGMTSCGLVPAYLMGLDINELYKGAAKGYQRYAANISIKDNPALQLAAYLAQLEKNGYTEIFTSIYSSSLFAFLPLIIQLIHESSGKDNKGQTIFGDYSPESQHHTNQRFFGGQKNVIGLFMEVENHPVDQTIKLPKKLTSIVYKNQPLQKLTGIKTSDCMRFDLEGVFNNALKKQIPCARITLKEITERSLGEFMVFWHYAAVYSALLRDQNPFDQPEVEDAKNLSFELRINH